MSNEFINEISNNILINFTQKAVTLLFPEMNNNYDASYIVENLNNYKQCRTIIKSKDDKVVASFWLVFRDYTCRAYGPGRVMSKQNGSNFSSEWREELYKHVSDKNAYVERFNLELDAELYNLKEKYEKEKEQLEKQRLVLKEEQQM